MAEVSAVLLLMGERKGANKSIKAKISATVYIFPSSFVTCSVVETKIIRVQN